MDNLDPNEVYSKFVATGTKWAKLDGVASQKEEMRKSKLAEIMNSFAETKVNRAEMLALCDSAYTEHIEKMVSARTEANIARAEYDAIRAWLDLTRTLESSKRAEMALSR